MTRAQILLPGLLFVAASASAGLPHLDCPDPGRAPGAHLSWVAPRIAADGLPMAILQLESKAPPQQVLSWYAQHWRGLRRHPADIFYRLGPWFVVARRLDGCFETMQVRPHGKGTLGEIGISLPKLGATSPQQPPVSLPPGSRVWLSLQNEDHGQSAENFLVSVPAQPIAAARFLGHALHSQGWVQQWMHHTPSGGYALMYQKTKNTAEISVTPHSGASDAFLTFIHH